MKFSKTQIVFISIAVFLFVLRIITPTPEQQMMDYYNQQNEQMLNQMNQQNQQMYMQNMQMMNGMQGYPQGGYVDPNASGYNGNYNDGYSNQSNNDGSGDASWGW